MSHVMPYGIMSLGPGEEGTGPDIGGLFTKKIIDVLEERLGSADFQFEQHYAALTENLWVPEAGLSTSKQLGLSCE